MIACTLVHDPPSRSFLILGRRSGLSLLPVGLLPFVFAGFVLDPLAAVAFFRMTRRCVVVRVIGGFIFSYVVPRCGCVVRVLVWLVWRGGCLSVAAVVAGCRRSCVVLGGGVTGAGRCLVRLCCRGAGGCLFIRAGGVRAWLGLRLQLQVWSRLCRVFCWCTAFPEWFVGCSLCGVCCCSCSVLGRWLAWKACGAGSCRGFRLGGRCGGISVWWVAAGRGCARPLRCYVCGRFHGSAKAHVTSHGSALGGGLACCHVRPAVVTVVPAGCVVCCWLVCGRLCCLRHGCGCVRWVGCLRLWVVWRIVGVAGCVVGAGGGGTSWVRCRIVRLGIAGRAEAEAGWLRGVLGGRGCRGWCLRWEVVAVRLHWECRLCWQLRDVL